MASQSIYVEIPGSDIKLYPGYKIKLNRFDSDIWTVHYGWYDFSGNRPIMGWYLTNDSDCNSVKPIQKIDLYDIYVVDTSEKSGVDVDMVQSDFEENNNLEPDYIKNRPFFEYGGVTNIDTRYDEWEYHILEDSFHNPVLSVEFPNVTIGVEPQKSYIAKFTIIGEEESGVITANAHCIGMVNSTYYLDVDDNEISILINGVPVNEVLTETFNLESKDNTISIMFGNLSIEEMAKLKSVGLSLIDVETAESETDYMEFTRVKLLNHKYFKDQYRYLNYTDNYFAITAETDENMVYVEIGVPVGFYSAEDGTIHYTVKDGIRVGDFHLASLQTIYIDMFPKNQEWDIWTLNSTEGGTVKTTPATSLLLQLTATDVESHIKYCTELYKTYLFRDEHNELGNLWAGLRWIVVFDTNENAQAFADKLNDNSGLTSITVRLKDIDYVEENIIPLIVPNTDDESEADSE